MTEAMEPSVAFDAALKLCRQPLREFTASSDDGTGFALSGGRPCYRLKIEVDRFPVPGSIRLVMQLLLRAHDLGRGEKLAWEYPFSFREIPCSVALQKFGLRLYIAAGLDVSPASDEEVASLSSDILRQLGSAVRCIERKVLTELAQHQVEAGNVTVRNQHGLLRGMYDYFRTQARIAYEGDGRLAQEFDVEHDGSMFATTFRFLAVNQEGLFATVAMTNAYFSLIEHLLVLALPATDFDPTTEDLSGLILAKWGEKFRRVFGNGEDNPTTKRILARLFDVAETWRNPFGHGGFDKDLGTLAFHVPNVGALPVTLSESRNHPTFRFAPERDVSFDELCALFDEVDEWLGAGVAWAGIRWARGGMDVQFDAEFLSDFRRAANEGEEAFDEYLDVMSDISDRYANMDW